MRSAFRATARRSGWRRRPRRWGSHRDQHQRRQVPWSCGDDLLFLWTDGLVDARNAAGEQFGEQRLLAAIAAHRHETPEDSGHAAYSRKPIAFGARPRTTARCSFCGSKRVPHAKRRLGQHFLTDPRLLARIADALEAGPADTVLEIGPGPGGLTAPLVERAGRVIAIEKDRDLVPALESRFPTVEVIEGRRARGRLASARLTGGSRSPGHRQHSLQHHLAAASTGHCCRRGPRRIVFLVQKEVAERVTAAAGTPDVWGADGRRAGGGAGERLFTVPAGAFNPARRWTLRSSDSRPLSRPLGDRCRAARASGVLVVGLFGFRRKQLLRGLRELTGWHARAGRARCSHAAGMPTTARPEVLSPGGVRPRCIAHSLTADGRPDSFVKHFT